ncbi:hypothetical protein [Streptomyces sp. CC219B]|nr:hypothetical protein [Streptomyces sp. CC219B]
MDTLTRTPPGAGRVLWVAGPLVGAAGGRGVVGFALGGLEGLGSEVGEL